MIADAATLVELALARRHHAAIPRRYRRPTGRPSLRWVEALTGGRWCPACRAIHPRDQFYAGQRSCKRVVLARQKFAFARRPE